MQLTLTQTHLTVELEWYEQLWAFMLHSTLVIPLNHIVSVTTIEPQSRWTDIRAPGSHVPGVIKAGTYYTRQGKEFWYVTAEDSFLTLVLQDEPYQKIVLTVEANEDWAIRLNAAR